MRTRVTLALVLAAGCGSELPPERSRTEFAFVEEREISAAFADADVELEIPLHLVGGSPQSGRLSVTLTNIGSDPVSEIASASIEIDQSARVESHALTLVGVGANIERWQTAPMVLTWRYSLPTGDLYGKRSLYATLGNLDVQLRGPTELDQGASSPVHVIVRDPHTQEPVDGAQVHATLIPEGGTEVTLFDAITDARGELLQEITLPSGVESGSLRVTVQKDRVQVWTSRNLHVRGDQRLYLGADKTLYQPGQNVQLRLLALDRGLPATDREIVFEAMDARGNKVFRRRVQTDRFGVAAVSVPTDTRVNEGDWRFSGALDGRHTEMRIPVRRYELPRMRVDVNAEREYALPGDSFDVHVSTRYSFGEPVIGATLSLDAHTLSGVPVYSYAGTTDATGQWTHTVNVPTSLPSSVEGGAEALVIAINVTDTAGQHEAGQVSLPLVTSPVQIDLIADPLSPSSTTPAWVLVTDAMGRPLQAHVELTLGAEVLSADTDASGIANVDLPATAASDVRVTVHATDGAGRTGQREISIGASSAGNLRIHADRAIYRAGDTAHLEIAASPDITRVYLDAYRGAASALSTAIDLENGHASIDLPISEEIGGLVVLDAFALPDDGTVVRTTRPLLVDRDNRLRIAIAPDRASYAPGEEASLEVRVEDASGAPQVASVGLNVVDDAVFTLGGEPGATIEGALGVDTSALRATRIAGRSAEDILASSDPVQRERLASLLFSSANGVGTPSFAYGSRADELPRVVSSLLVRVQTDARSMIEAITGTGHYDPQTFPALVAGQHRIDPFGREYHFSVEGPNQWNVQLVARCDGPDETPDTADDIVAQMQLWQELAEADGDFGGPRFAGPVPGVAPAPEEPNAGGRAGGGATVRNDFRENVYSNPMLITDGNGRATVSFPLAHSITTWRATAEGSSLDGHVGSARQHFRTFQSFFVDFSAPARLTRGDTLELPAVIYNYEADARDVTVSIDAGDFFALESAPTATVSLGPSEVRAVRFRVRLTGAGDHAITLRATAGSVSDALTRSVHIDPNGQPEDRSSSIALTGASDQLVEIPSDTVPGGASVEMVITPGFASEAVQGVEALLKEPTGCFEQTNSSAWPNTLVAGYLDRTGALTPERREEVLALITRGYQRLLTFESPTGGYNWWGNADPGNRILSAIMLWHLHDLEGLIETDEAVRTRTLDWLLRQQNADGSFASGDALHAGNEVLGTDQARTTAFIAWALAHTGWAPEAVERAAGWLRVNTPDESDLYANALVANALAMADPSSTVTTALFTRLDSMRVDRGEQGYLWPTTAPSWTGAAGDAAAIETTGLVAYAMMQARAYPDDAQGALRFILANKDSIGTWYNTQATMNALRALSAGASGTSTDTEGTIVVSVGGTEVQRIVIDADNRDLTRRFDLTPYVGTGSNQVHLSWTGTGSPSVRLSRRAYRPVMPAAVGPLSMDLAYDTTRGTVATPILATVNAHNNEASGVRDQVIVRVGRAPGFDPMRADLDALVTSGRVARYEVRETDVTFYLMGLAAGETRMLTYRLTPGLVATATAPSSSIYAYYEPSLQHTVDAVNFTVAAAR